ncbi:hypothetical protein NOM03_17640, partial [Proteus terrae]
ILLRKLNIPRKKGSPDIEEYIFKEEYPVSSLAYKPIPLVKDVNYYIPIEIELNDKKRIK